jgi:hypothetical protein
MGRPTLGKRAMTSAERQAKAREHKAAQHEAFRKALERIKKARTGSEARSIAIWALAID